MGITVTPEQLRADIQDGIARLENTILWLRMNETQRAETRAQAQYWAQASDAELQKLAGLVSSQPFRSTTMANKELTEKQKQTLTAAGIDWQALLQKLQKLGPLAMQILQVISAFLSQPQQMAAKPGTCDHHACCQAVLASALETAALAADHCCQCCEEGNS